MRSIIRALEVDHTINAGEGCAATLVAMRIELLLGQNIAARLPHLVSLIELWYTQVKSLTSQEKDTMVVR